MKWITIFIICTISFALGCQKYGEYTPPGTTTTANISKVRGYQDCYIGDFRCGLFVPPTYDARKKYPLIVRLHGYSDTTSWDLPWYNEPIVSEDPCIVLTPKCPVSESGWGDSFSTTITPMMKKTFDMMNKIEETFNVDKNRYYIYGSSMGGIGTYGVIQKKLNMFAAAWIECGKPNIEIASIIASIPIWIFHGSDDPVVPVQPTRDFYQAVLALGGTKIRYTEYRGVKHNVWDYIGDETTLCPWLLAQSRGSEHSEPAGISGFTAGLSVNNKLVNLQWNLPSGTTVAQDDKVWYCRIYRNNIKIAEIYNNRNNYIDSTAYGSVEYKISAVNFYFKESDVSQPVAIIVGK